jgi:hypothetical protein
MPDELDKKTTGDGSGSGEAGAGGAGEGNGSGSGSNAGSGDGSTNNSETGSGSGNAGDEVITIKKSDWDKTNRDLTNYKEATVRKKADERALDGSSTGAGDVQNGGQGGGTVTIDEKKITETATAAATKVQREAAQRSAKQEFFRKHPEYLDDSAWKSLMENTTFRGTELTTEEYLNRMESGMYEHLRVTGKLEEHLTKIREEGRRQGQIESTFGGARSTGGAGDRTTGDGRNKGALSPAGVQMAAKFRIDPKKAENVDPHTDNTIDISKV